MTSPPPNSVVSSVRKLIGKNKVKEEPPSPPREKRRMSAIGMETCTQVRIVLLFIKLYTYVYRHYWMSLLSV